MGNTGALITASAAARMLGVSVKTLIKWRRAGLVPVVKDPLTGSYRYSKPALDRWLADNCPSQNERAS